MAKRSLLVASLFIACIWLGGTLSSTSFTQRASVPRQPDPVAIASEKAKELLALMDTGKDGKISKQQWMQFMGAVFDKLDKNKTGAIDPREFAQPHKPVRFDNK